MRARHLTQGINRLYHPQKGMARSNNEQRQCNKFPDETTVANHNIAGASKIRAESIYNNEVSPPKHFIQPKNAKKFVNETDGSGRPNFWSVDGQLIVSQMGHTLCGYCGVPSYSREICGLRQQDEGKGRFYDAHPNQGQILSKKLSTKQLQPAKGASYKMFKQHSYHNKERARSIQERSIQVNIRQGDSNSWDFNHNSSPKNLKHIKTRKSTWKTS